MRRGEFLADDCRRRRGARMIEPGAMNRDRAPFSRAMSHRTEPSSHRSFTAPKRLLVNRAGIVHRMTFTLRPALRERNPMSACVEDFEPAAWPNPSPNHPLTPPHTGT